MQQTSVLAVDAVMTIKRVFDAAIVARNSRQELDPYHYDAVDRN